MVNVGDNEDWGWIDTLPALAAAALREALSDPGPPGESRSVPVASRSASPQLAEPGCCFVTLRRDGALRGCIGTISPYRTLREDVVGNARAAALHDPRFPPVEPAELPELDIEVSVLGPPTPTYVTSYPDLLRTLRPQVDGVVVTAGRHRAVMLPAVWRELPDPKDYVAAVWRKAGLMPGDWPDGIRVECFSTRESSLRAPRQR